MIEYKIEGIPRPQGSKRHIGGGRMVEDSKYVKPWRAFARLKATAAMRAGRLAVIDMPVMLTVHFRFERPKSHFLSDGKTLRLTAPAEHKQKPDIDKLLRALLDSMTGVVFIDDSQVIRISADKGWATSSGTSVCVEW